MPNKFEEIIKDIDNDVIKLSEQIIQNLTLSINSYMESKKEMCYLAISNSKNIINNLEKLENKVIKTLCLYRPVSKDLRKILVLIKLILMLEKVLESSIKISERLLQSKYNFNRKNSYLLEMLNLTKKNDFFMY